MHATRWSLDFFSTQQTKKVFPRRFPAGKWRKFFPYFSRLLRNPEWKTLQLRSFFKPRISVWGRHGPLARWSIQADARTSWRNFFMFLWNLFFFASSRFDSRLSRSSSSASGLPQTSNALFSILKSRLLLRWREKFNKIKTNFFLIWERKKSLNKCETKNWNRMDKTLEKNNNLFAEYPLRVLTILCLSDFRHHATRTLKLRTNILSLKKKQTSSFQCGEARNRRKYNGKQQSRKIMTLREQAGLARVTSYIKISNIFCFLHCHVRNKRPMRATNHEWKCSWASAGGANRHLSPRKLGQRTKYF